MVLVKFISIYLCVLYLSRGAFSTQHRSEPIYSNEFAVHIPHGKGEADEIALKHGFVNRGQVSLITYQHLLK